MLIPISAACSLSDLQQSEQDRCCFVYKRRRGVVSWTRKPYDHRPRLYFSQAIQHHFGNAEKLGTLKKKHKGRLVVSAPEGIQGIDIQHSRWLPPCPSRGRVSS